jgi:hypothetical protein
MVILPGGSTEVLNKETGEREYMSAEQWVRNKDSGKYIPVTNGNKLWERANDPSKAYDTTSLSIVQNGIGLNKVAKEIKDRFSKIGAISKNDSFYYTKQGQDIIQGYEALQQAIANGPEGVYRIKEENKD